jgi:hypothetical protein
MLEEISFPGPAELKMNASFDEPGVDVPSDEEDLRIIFAQSTNTIRARRQQ